MDPLSSTNVIADILLSDTACYIQLITQSLHCTCLHSTLQLNVKNYNYTQLSIIQEQINRFAA
jgi:hypothetical protein